MQKLFKSILSVSFYIKISFELQINFRMIDVVRQDKKYAPIIQSRDMHITIFRYDGVALNNETLNMWF